MRRDHSSCNLERNRNILHDKASKGKTSRTIRDHPAQGRPTNQTRRNLDIRGLGRKLCEVLGARSGDTIEFHMLADGSVRVVSYGAK